MTGTAPPILKAAAVAKPNRARSRQPPRPGRVLTAVTVSAALALTIYISRSHDERAARLVKRFTDGAPGENDVGTLFGIDYEELYLSTPPALRPVFVTFLVLILLLLFCSISITASDFFCPNLASIAAYLGLSETTAGVTLLAFGNGSPDVFSTFASVKSGTFGLAIGELIGAASFITSIVVGSIALVQPFQVPRHAFVRDSLFFISAVILLMVVLADGRLTLRESGAMVILYVFYVAVVVMGNWWLSRKRREQDYAELGWKRPDEEEQIEPVDTDPQLVPQPVPSPLSSRRGSASRHEDDDIADTPARANFSLLGAVEFRDVVNSLRREMNTPTGSPLSSRPNSPVSPWDEGEPSYFHHHHYRHRRTSGSAALERTLARRVSGRNRSGSLHPNWTSRRSTSGDDVAASAPAPAMLDHVPGSPNEPESLPLASLPPSAGPTKRPPHLSRTSLPALKIPGPSTGLPVVDYTESPRGGSLSGATPTVTPGTGGPSPVQEEVEAEPEPSPVPRLDLSTPDGETVPLRLSRTTTFGSIVEAGKVANDWVRAILCILFPSLQHFGQKSLLNKGLALLSTPAIFALTITLPVVDDGRQDEGGIALPDDDEPLPRHLEEEEELEHLYEQGVAVSLAHVRHHSHVESPTPSECDSVCSEPSLVQFTPALAAAQCFFGPLVCTYLVFQEEPYLPWVLLGCGLAGSVCAAITYTCSTDGNKQPWRLVRCVAGFVCSTVWIASIADEVVAVLRTFGEIFGLSDAIIGLTIFAVGNSLADLVANVTIAQFAPNMAYAACFGGPMLNLLLGVGGSGSYWILRNPQHAPVRIHFSPTLWVSGVGLIAILVTTAVVVPLNKYRIDKKWAAVLLVAYASLMTLNVIVEIKTGK